ncbi:hypothetical protein E2C01_011141 [Portunus trituberculatus]|uniref:Uncharacterized protein n=1 Tax=Portunus trituberculatus TaxID=210409 RepID=A0A5B7DAL4_PORTR|nr:hypothetical protein [Portunus trituberculatus]
MNKAPGKKRSVEAISEEHSFTASSGYSQDICLVTGQPRETIIHVKKVKLPVGGTEKLCLPTAADRMASLDLTRQRVNPHTPAAGFTPTDSTSLSPGLQGVMDTDATFCASLPLPGTFLRGTRPSFGSRHVIAGELPPQLQGLVKGIVPSLVHLLGLGHFCVGLYSPEPDLCDHCFRFGHQSWRCKSSLCCRPMPVRESQTPSITVGPSRVLFRPGPPPQHNAWTNGTLFWSDFPTLPLPAAQPSGFLLLPGTVVPAQSGAAQSPVPATLSPVPVPLRLLYQYLNLPARTTPGVCRPDPGPNQCLPQSSLSHITRPRVCWPAHSLSQCLPQFSLHSSLPLSPRMCWLVLSSGKSSHQLQSSHCSYWPWPRPFSVLDRMLPLSGSSSVEADLVFDSHDMDADEE